MIPVILIILGLLLAAGGVICIILIAFSPVVVKIRSVFGLLELEEDKRTKQFRKKHRRELMSYSVTASLLGLVLALAGWCIGYAQKGEDFWFYRKYKQHFVSGEISEEWDRISEDGKYTDNNGNKYTYYILVKGRDISFCRENCRNTDDLKEKLERIPRENTVMIIDSYAVSAEINDVKALLKEMGIKYETEEV